MIMLQKIPFTKVELTGGLWKELGNTIRTAALPAQYEKCETTGRLDAFKLQEREGCGPISGVWESDVAKWMEGAAYSLAQHPDPDLERKLDAIIEDMKRCQEPDGYLNPHNSKYGLENRWTNLRDAHELYCAGHLIEAAVAYWQTSGKRAFLDIMCRYADYIDSVFGPGKDQIPGYPGHQEIELALVKLFEATSEGRYLKLAAFFINQRGSHSKDEEHYFDREARKRGADPDEYRFETHEYSQSHIPVREQTEVVGHAVRALYLYSGMADVAAHTSDKELLAACKRLWKNLVTRRLAITGGVGAREQNEGMTTDFDLPAEGAYNETCAAIALVFWAHRLFLATGESEYLDVMERAMFNGTISGLAHTGTEYFYGNPLAVHPGFDGNGVYHGQRQHESMVDGQYRRIPWFNCSCCPTNLARYIPQISGYLYAVKETTLYACVYADSRAILTIGASEVKLTQTTDYPWDGRVTFTVSPAAITEWTLALRIPGWCRQAEVKVNGQSVEATPTHGFVCIEREWQEGDTVELFLSMPVEQMAVNPRARQVAGKVALQRGPVVYCLEEVDNGSNLTNVFLKEDTSFKIEQGPESLGGVPVLTAAAWAEDLVPWADALYALRRQGMVPRNIAAVPYFLWGNRSPGEMNVFVGKCN
jgi:DUF1680 family protein